MPPVNRIRPLLELSLIDISDAYEREDTSIINRCETNPSIKAVLLDTFDETIMNGFLPRRYRTLPPIPKVARLIQTLLEYDRNAPLDKTSLEQRLKRRDQYDLYAFYERLPVRRPVENVHTNARGEPDDPESYARLDRLARDSENWMSASADEISTITDLNLAPIPGHTYSLSLYRIPAAIQLFRNLRTFSVERCDTLTALPEDFNPPNLESLDLSFSGIDQLPDHFNPPHLLFLDLRGTQIKNGPKFLMSKRSLYSISKSLLSPPVITSLIILILSTFLRPREYTNQQIF